MGKRQPFTAADDTVWLSSLVDTFARTEQLHDKPCDAASMSAAMARLQRPAVVRRPTAARRFDRLEFSF